MALRFSRGTSPDNRHAAWVSVIERSYHEQVQQGWRHRNFRLARAVFTTNDKLAADGGFIFNWMAENYLDSALMVIRRELDVQAGTENLRNLLEDIIENPTVLTRGRYLAQWGPADHDLANHVFDSFSPVRVPNTPNDDHVDPVIVRSDLENLDADCERLRVFAERTRAHRSPNRGIDKSITFKDLHSAISDMRDVVGKYYALLTQRSVVDWEPEPMYDTFEAFKSPWITDADKVAEKLEE